MARKPTDAVQFTLESAERIADVVRAAELATPAGKPLTFDAAPAAAKVKMIRAATFTGSWAVGASKAVTFKYAPTVTQTVTNLSWPITHNHSTPENCLVGKEGTSWWLVVPVLQAATAVFVTQTEQRTFCSAAASLGVVSGIDLSASLNTNNCTITIGKTLTTSLVTVVSATATASFIASQATATYLRLRVP
jgi:uncharacterized protein (DUF2384 family)